MKTKIFISINIPDKAKKRLLIATEKWRDLPVKWVREQNLHITLAFLGFVDESVVAGICEKVSAAARENESFDINFSEISLFPSATEPRLIALSGADSEELKNLVNDLEDALGISSAHKKTFSPHITLGRVRKIRWSELKEKPEISQKFPLLVPVESIDIMASNFGEGENEYSLIQSCPLK